MNYDYNFGNDYYNYYGDLGIKSTKYKIMAPEQEQDVQPGMEYLMYPSPIFDNGKSIAIYIDKNNKKHIVYNKCPHLKCSLIFNEKEKTWDCPCHGSRFDIDGKCIEGPSNYDIVYKNK